MYSLDEKFMKFVDKFGIKESSKKEEYYSGNFDESKQPSRIDKFNARFQKFQNRLKTEQKPTELGE